MDDFVWCWVLIDLQLISAGVLVPQTRRWSDPSQLLLTSLFAAQLGLVTVWAVLGTTWWVARLPTALILAAFLAMPLLGHRYRRIDLTEMFFAQTVALVAICLTMRWQGFRLRAERLAASPGHSGGLGNLQFGVRHVLIWTTSLAVALAIARALGLLSPDLFRDLLGNQWLSLTSAGIVVAIVLVVALWAALGHGSAGLRWTTLAWLAALTGLCLSFLFAVAEHATAWGGPQRMRFRTSFWNSLWNQWDMYFARHWWLIAWVALAGGLLFAALLIFRTLGYRLTRSPRQTTRP